MHVAGGHVPVWTPARTSEGLRSWRFPWESTRVILGPLAMKTSADSAEGYSGPTQESKIPESFWGWSLGLKLPQTSFCAKVRAQNRAVSTGSCPAPASASHPWLARCRRGAVPSGRSGSWGLRPQSRPRRWWEGSPGVRGQPELLSQASAWAGSQ